MSGQYQTQVKIDNQAVTDQILIRIENSIFSTFYLENSLVEISNTLAQLTI